MTRPIVCRLGEQDDREAMAWGWGIEAGAILRYQDVRDVDVWRRQLDDVQEEMIVWRPYMLQHFRG